ncbi:SMP-30/gluconolactonase/LRE family protein [Paracoccus sp. P2]|uniref:SMP-30/gluconolactonase/LRE family protein n=1 Tax=Paracoccus sp. P2 TaxID=3248840 RepID=UPI00391FB72C
MSEPQLLAEGFRFLEAPKWRDGRLWVSDVFDLKVIEMTDDGKQIVTTIDVPHRPAGLGFLPHGDLLIISQADQKLLRWNGTDLSIHADLAGHATGFLNDMAIDATGHIYCGDFGYDYVAGELPRATALYRVDPAGGVARVAEAVEFPNGSVIVDQGRTLIVAETWVGRITAFDLSPDGQLSNRRLFADLSPCQPDGLCADVEGAIWVACYNTGEFLRVLDGGTITDRFTVDGRGISCTLGGADGHTLYMTAFLGDEDDMAAGKRCGVVLAAQVGVSAP